jgi:NADPH-dependent 2,4-dienoyl-CoA reductase/sulfur reductase-like enzyme
MANLEKSNIKPSFPSPQWMTIRTETGKWVRYGFLRFELIVKCYKIIIVGAGLGGLVAGIALSKKGHKVTILEAASKLGEVISQVGNVNIRSALEFKCLQTRPKF